MPVTDSVSGAMPDKTRNEIIEAEAEAAAAHAQEHFDQLAAAFHENADEYATVSAARVLSRSAWRCQMCKRVFHEGDTVFLRRNHGWPGSGSWKLDAACLDCAAKWHPSWMESAKKPVECAGGCGVLVTWAYFNSPTTCSHRCTEIATQRKRRVLHDERECVECHAPFLPSRSDARFCSTTCRMRAYRRRRSA